MASLQLHSRPSSAFPLWSVHSRTPVLTTGGSLRCHVTAPATGRLGLHSGRGLVPSFYSVSHKSAFTQPSCNYRPSRLESLSDVPMSISSWPHSFSLSTGAMLLYARLPRRALSSIPMRYQSLGSFSMMTYGPLYFSLSFLDSPHAVGSRSTKTTSPGS